MDVNLCLIRLCGIFSFTENERQELLNDGEFYHKFPHKESWDYIQHQYYPVFRKFISNGLSQNDKPNQTEFDILTAKDKKLTENYKCEFHSAPGNGFILFIFLLQMSKYFFIRKALELFPWKLGLVIPVANWICFHP